MRWRRRRFQRQRRAERVRQAAFARTIQRSIAEVLGGYAGAPNLKSERAKMCSAVARALGVPKTDVRIEDATLFVKGNAMTFSFGVRG